MKRRLFTASLVCFVLAGMNLPARAGRITVSHQPEKKLVEFGNGTLRFKLEYDRKCAVTALAVDGEQVVSGPGGIFTAIRTATAEYSTRALAESPLIETAADRVTLRGIRYGPDESAISESWVFRVTESDIRLEIERTVARPFEAEDVAFPAVTFNRLRTWDGAFTGFGGLAWFYLFNEKLCTYGVHSGDSAFWNGTTGKGLIISAASPGLQAASKFTRTADDELAYAVSLSEGERKYRYDPDTKRRRFIRNKMDVWDSLTVPAGKTAESVTFSALDYGREYDRGTFVGIDGNRVTRLLNTIARIGVIDARLFGGNSWHTPYGPICLHEQYIGQIGAAANDPRYTEGYKQCLDSYRDLAIQPSGRVLARWAYDNSDAMPGTATPAGFYEAQWGYLMDSNPDYVVNVVDLYNQCGDLGWVAGHKKACEAALDYMLKRDSDGDHLAEMMTDDHEAKRGSDWLDLIWAAHENAFVNAKLYYALLSWSGLEKQLADPAKADFYSAWAAQLKTSFNKSTGAGGFWDEKNRWYIHWRDKDGSLHGNNLVVPVNFMAVAYGICDDDLRRQVILDRTEDQMQEEKLFAWPICLYSYEKGEADDWQLPFPNYENGDIFLSWAGLGVEAYAGYKPELALKYIDNILARYEKDGLAFQHYQRLTQEGDGDDILAGNCLAIVGLYRSIYGLNPLHNRMYVHPHLPDKLAGTELIYRFRGDTLKIRLDKTRHSVSNGRFTLSAAGDFGFNAGGNELAFFPAAAEAHALKARTAGKAALTISIVTWGNGEYVWTQQPAGPKDKIAYEARGLKPAHEYTVSVDGLTVRTLRSSPAGVLEFGIDPGPDGSGAQTVRIQENSR